MYVPREIQIEIFLFEPSAKLYNEMDYEAKDIALDLLSELKGNAYKYLFLYDIGELDSILPVLYYADHDVFTIILDYDFDDWTDIAIFSSKANYEDIVLELLDRNIANYDEIAYNAATNNNKNIIKKLVYDIGYDNYNNIAKAAAREGNKELTITMLKRGANNYYIILTSAISSCNTDLVMTLVKREDFDFSYDDIARNAASSGCIAIVNEAIKRGATNYDEIAKYAALGCNKELVLDMIEMGVNDLTSIARNAAFSGCITIVNEMIRLGVTDYYHIALIAAFKGYRDIVMSIINKVSNIDDILHLAAYNKEIADDLVRMGASFVYKREDKRVLASYIMDML